MNISIFVKILHIMQNFTKIDPSSALIVLWKIEENENLNNIHT